MHLIARQLREPTRRPKVKAWLAEHPRFHLHFTPTSASWLNLVERFFAEITDEAHPARHLPSVAELEQAIRDYLDEHNADPKPFVWTKSANAILKKDRRALQQLALQYDGNQASKSEH